MSIPSNLYNFFDSSCQEPAINKLEFWLCDDSSAPQAPAYSALTHDHNCIAQVLNPKALSVILTAIDKCVIPASSKSGHTPQACDVMLTYYE